ncbi:MAG: hypothetical protein M1825_000502 [Sarcosagium campestre]|nr:MAG: hypothetical protein M1825_000502 [Sarcosagium campestre]
MASMNTDELGESSRQAEQRAEYVKLPYSLVQDGRAEGRPAGDRPSSGLTRWKSASDWSAVDINTYVLVFSSPGWIDKDDDQLYHAPPNISYSLDVDTNVRTLSTNTAGNGARIDGLLYVPDLAPSDPCFNVSKQYVPLNTTRRSNLPIMDYDLIAVAPWISPNCTLSYLAAARQDPARAFIFYLTDHGEGELPLANKPQWGLDDGGQWKSNNPYPVFAIPGSKGDDLMRNLAHYSGNLTDVDHGHDLASFFDPRDFARLYTVITTSNGNSLPSLWVFLLIVLGVLVFIIALVSAAMHWVQYRRRQWLRSRVASGEVDLEGLGIKRLTVPGDLLQKMPLSLYTPLAADGPDASPRKSADHDPSPLHHDLSPDGTASAPLHPASIPLPPSPTSTHHRPRSSHDESHTAASSQSPPQAQSYAQPTCPICLDDFIPNQTEVRQLPCAHIYHPQCVDVFLQTSSSLCPMCKTSVLPRGFCPTKVTDAMVRRERMLRRMRERVDVVSVPVRVPVSASVPVRVRRDPALAPLDASPPLPSSYSTSSLPQASRVGPPAPTPSPSVWHRYLNLTRLQSLNLRQIGHRLFDPSPITSSPSQRQSQNRHTPADSSMTRVEMTPLPPDPQPGVNTATSSQPSVNIARTTSSPQPQTTDQPVEGGSRGAAWARQRASAMLALRQGTASALRTGQTFQTDDDDAQADANRPACT